MSRRNAVMHIWRIVLKDLTRTVIRLPLFPVFSARARARSRVLATGEGYPLVRARARASRLMDSGEIILAEYQMSGKDCRIIQARGY